MVLVGALAQLAGPVLAVGIAGTAGAVAVPLLLGRAKTRRPDAARTTPRTVSL